MGSRTQTVPPPGHFVEVNGFNIHYEKLGNGSRIVLLLPGGLGSTRTDFGPQLELMDKTKYTLVAWDAPGYGYSRPPERQYELGAQLYQKDADLAAALMKKLGYNSYSLMGWSAGGKTALVLAASYPSRIEKLVVWGTTAVVTERQKQILDAGENVSFWDPSKREKFYRIYGDATQQIWTKHVKFCMGLSDVCKSHVKKIRSPTMVFYGDKDFIEQEEVNYIIKSIGEVQHHRFPEGRHDMHLQYVDEFNKLVDKFLTEEVDFRF
ncbi:Valacyclovir hydrolase [Halotydeus destructor]|nr:Valacyclovir hydrolase [Halotydeus destructor]